jgi:hypothetical protein
MVVPGVIVQPCYCTMYWRTVQLHAFTSFLFDDVLGQSYSYSSIRTLTRKYSTLLLEYQVVPGRRHCKPTSYMVPWVRNEVVHGRDEQERRCKQEKDNLRKLRHIYSQREFMEPSVQDLLFDDIQDHEKLPSYAIQNWLAVHESVFVHSVKQVTRRAVQGVRNIRSYFTVIQPAPVPFPTQDSEVGPP